MSESAPQNDSQKPQNKRKRKKTFLKNARKYAKKGCFGRGSQLDPDTYQYFVRILEAYSEGFENDEDKRVFVDNVFEQTIDQEVNCCCNQVGCRVIETLIPFSSNVVLLRFIEKFGDELRPLCADRFASHVLEALVRTCGIKSRQDDDFKEKSKEFVLKVSKFLLNNLEDYIWDNYGNHIMRTCLLNLANLPVENPKKSTAFQKVVESEEEENHIEDYFEVVKDYGQRIIHWPQFNELCNNEITSGFLQILLKALHKVDLKMFRQYVKKLTDEYFIFDKKDDENYMPQVFMSISMMMLLETTIQLASKKQYTKIYANCFQDRLAKLATTRSTNFAVQKLIMSSTEKEEFEAIFDELEDHFKKIIECGHSGIILALAENCKKFSTKQGIFVKNMMAALDCQEPEERQLDFVWCLAKLTDFNSINNEIKTNIQKEKLNLHGTLIIQLILDFNKPIKVVQSILNMKPTELKGFFSNTMGSHVVDSFVKSTFVGEKSREKLIKRLSGNYQELASHKFGSRSFEAIWNVASLKHKISIMEELSYKDGAWANSEFGQIIANKVNLRLFKRNKEQWKQSLNTVNKVEKLFEDIVK